MPHGKAPQLFYILDKLINEYGASTLVYESIDFGVHKSQADSYGRFVGVIELIAFNHQLDIECYGPKHIKRIAAGIGDASKGQVIESINTKYGLSVTDDNEADAIAIYHTYMEALCRMK